jgi:integrase/recombinase XerC
MDAIQPQTFFKVQQRDLLAELLADKRSPETRRAYARDLKDFFRAIADADPTPQLVAEFLKLDRFTAIGLVLNYKQQLTEKGLAEATINRRLAAVKSLVKYAAKVGKCEWSLEEVQGERVQAYRDTSGIGAEAYARLLAVPDRSTLKGLRDYAILRLLWDNALRRGEVARCNAEDFNPEARTLRIFGKGRGTQAETVNLSQKTTEAIWAWVNARGAAPTDPLFVACDRASFGHRLSGNAIYNLVKDAAVKAGLPKKLSPHRCRHSSITAALDATHGDVRKVQQLSRHKKVETVLIYWDNAAGVQRELTETLSNLI